MRGNYGEGDVPKIDTSDFEFTLALYSRPKLDPAFVGLIKKIVDELGLTKKLRTIAVKAPNDPLNPNAHAQLYREPRTLSLSPDVVLDMYLDRDKYLNENLIRHEFGHEADRHFLPGYDPKLDEWWPCTSASFWALNIAMNISIDTQPGRLSKEANHAEFRKHLGINHDSCFEGHWAHPPISWDAIEKLAKKLLLLKNSASPQFVLS